MARLPHFITTQVAAAMLGLTGAATAGSVQKSVRRLVDEGLLKPAATYGAGGAGFGYLFKEHEVRRLAKKWKPARVSRGPGLVGSRPA